MMKTPDELTHKLKELLKDNLVSVVLYGSAAADDKTEKFSDTNVLVVVKSLELSTLKLLGPLVKQWTKGGNPPPLVFTEKRLFEAHDVFPLEFQDIKDMHRILYGHDVFQEISVDPRHLRHQLEFELRGKLLQLRERYMETEGKPRLVEELLAKAISTFAVLFKGILRLENRVVPAHRADLWSAVQQFVPIDVEALNQIMNFRRRNAKMSEETSADDLFERLLASVEAAVDFVNDHKGG